MAGFSLAASFIFLTPPAMSFLGACLLVAFEAPLLATRFLTPPLLETPCMVVVLVTSEPRLRERNWLAILLTLSTDVCESSPWFSFF